MKKYKCKICSYESNADCEPQNCENCGSNGDIWSVLATGLTKFIISNSDSKCIVYKDSTFGRDEIKQFFINIKDEKGNEVYKYCDNDKPMLEFTVKKDDSFQVSAIKDTKNCFLLNDKEIQEIKIELKNDDKLQLYSKSQSKIICEFIILEK